jgi:hypothetical protein
MRIMILHFYKISFHYFEEYSMTKLTLGVRRHLSYKKMLFVYFYFYLQKLVLEV